MIPAEAVLRLPVDGNPVEVLAVSPLTSMSPSYGLADMKPTTTYSVSAATVADVSTLPKWLEDVLYLAASLSFELAPRTLAANV